MPTRLFPWSALRSAAAAVALALAATAASAATFTVTKTADTNDGTCNADCSLREAITAANGSSGPHTIAFNIPGSGVQTITLTGALPNIIQAVTIDGFTQPGASPNTNATGAINAVPLIEINGGGANPAIQVLTSNVTIRGLVVNGSFTPIQVLAGTNVVVAGSFIGTTANGLASGATAVQSGIRFQDASGTVGGLLPQDRNVIGGGIDSINNENGIVVSGGASVLIVGNLIGIDKTGTVALPFDEAGVRVNAIVGGPEPNAVIGGNTPAHRNVISGISFSGDGGSAGISVGGCGGGFTCRANSVTIQGNFIGTTADGTGAVPNFHGIILNGSTSTLVGGTGPGEGNLISGNLGAGLKVSQDFAPGGNNDGYRILGNRIFGNGQLGIDLEANITPLVNDAGDTDVSRQNFPVVTSLSFTGGAVTIGGTLNSAANRTYRLEFFANDAADASSFGEGQIFLGAIDVTTNGSGNASFTTPALGSGLVATQFITATATDLTTNDTSEFSQLTADLSVTITDTPDPAAPNADVTYTLVATNLGSVSASGVVTMSMAVPAGATFVSATGGVTPSGGTLSFNLGALAVGQTAQRQVVVRYATTGAKAATVTVTSTVTDSVPANNSASATTTVTVPQVISISGTVRTGINTALPGTTLTLTGPVNATTTSGNNGTYSFTNLPQGTYTVTPSIAGRVFEPGARTLTAATVNQTGVDFVGRLVWKITGQVRDLNDTGVPGVTMTLSGDQAATTTTDLNGNYEFTGIVNGRTVTVTPTRATFAFNPASQTFPNISKDEVAGFFVAQVGTFTRYFAEGATGTFFDTQIALLNATGNPATATLKFQKGDGTEVTQQVSLGGVDRKTIIPEQIAGLENAAFSTEVTSDQPLIADRTMTWDTRRYGSHAETSIGRPLTRWFLAEGATINGFDLFYLIQNPNNTAANVQVRYLLPTGAPLVRTYQVAPRSRFNIWVNLEDPALAAAEVSADITSDLPVIVERAMYRTVGGRQFSLGHESAGVEAPALQWYFAEGNTGPFFDLFYLIANPNDAPAIVEATYLKPDGSVVVKTYTAPANSRFNIWVDFEGADLANTAMGTTFRVTNNVPVVIERAMWWAGDFTQWVEGHNTAGAIATGEKWGLAEGEVGGAPFFTDTYILVANTSTSAGTVRVTLIFDDGSPSVTRDFPINGSSRLNVATRAEFPGASGKRFGAIVESVGATPVQLVVERAMYNSSDGVTFAAGTSALGTLLRPGAAQATASLK
ncbi:hypothetical protein TBR22_A02180 [Luteitalea sp. TBR-22]|uniref:carboxypeptidase regulatory-like domain-containing protein n=1 Tax=Luteitalea sp. TBR-22 TaxID=2802971 RepID=UPI001AF143EF|nr:carboxypeptidase regulatory-like domain-containing protein [Luteitalea sp. TBR-22]BCS31019.1 hypothetical protein TBR22_A02180 [Luteitalea sp. TBR-22]